MMKTGKNKRLLASILAASMLLAMSPFALAEGTEDATNQTGQEQSQGQPTGGGGTEQTCAAKIGENKYPTLAGALAAANIYDANSDVTIVMLRDVTENIKIHRSLTLDLGGFTLSGDGDAEAAVVTISGDKPQVTVKNGTVTGGRNPQNGGGFAIDSAGVQLEDLTITGNETVGDNGNGEVGGGGIYASHADVSMQNVTVSKNSVTGSSSDGGGILVRYGSLTMNGCHVEGNTAPDCGGGMILRHSVLNAAKSFFEKNTAKYGAGIYFGDTPNEAEEGCSGEHNHLITDSTISGNKVLDLENGIGGGMYVGTTSNLTLRNSKLLNNDGASQGGAIVAYSAGTIELDDVSISENKAQSGAGIFAMCTAADNTDIRLLNGTAIDKNTATGDGGGIYAYALANTHSVTVANSSVSGNTAASGAGIFTYKSGSAVINVDLQSGAVMHNNNAVTNMGGAIYANASNINIAANSAVYNNTAKTAGDDLLFNGSTFTLPNAKDMSGDRILSSDKAEITGWYHDGWFKWNAAAQDGKGGYEEIGRWTVETADEYVPVENDSHAVSLKAATKKSSGGTEDTDPIEWNVSRSKTATALDTSTWTSNVTLSLPSAEEALASDVVFVLDKSTSAEKEEQALGMLTALKEQTAKTGAKVKVGVVIFNKQANVTAPLTDLATDSGYKTIEAAIKQGFSSGTNTHAGLLAGKQLLDEDTEVAANRKYLIFVSDGITYMYNAEPTVTAWSFKADFWKHWAAPNNWSSKNGNDDPPDNWSAWMTKIGAQVEAQGTEYEYPYEPSGETATKWTPEKDDTYKDYANSIDKALYLTYQVYQEAKTKGYNCYAVANESSTDYHWGPAFMRYLANGETVNFDKIQNDILYAVSAGSTVEDQMGDAFDFVPDSLKLTVGGTELKSKANGNMTYFGDDVENLSENNCRFKVLYAPDTDAFVWTINENVSNFAPVQLTYTVKLTKPETAPGTYGTEDLKGEKNVPADKALFTNKRAVLNAINSAGAPLNPLDFPKPSVSYTVKKSSSGGGGGRRPTVTIPDDVPTGLNGDDHYAYIVGYPNGNVEPNGNITRAEVATIFFRLLTEEVRTANSTQSNSLSDVTRGQWFNHAVSTLSSMGIVKGHNDGTFAPNAPITRAEFAAIAARFDDKNTDTSSKFTDIASHWAKNEIGIAANKGWINGYPDGTFRPNQYITRAEAMTLVNRVLNRLPENSSDLLDSMIKWPDNSDASQWFYLAVQEATNSHYYKTKENKFEKWTELRETRDWTELEK